MGTLIAALIIVGVILFFNKRKQKKKEEEERDPLFADAAVGFVAMVANGEKDENFRKLYNDVMNKVVSKEKDEMLKEIPLLKQDYKEALGKLVSISDQNTVFFTEDEQKYNLYKNFSVMDRDKKISEDIIRSLPCISEFVAVHKKLVSILLEGYLKEVTYQHMWLWRGIKFENEQKGLLKEMFDMANGFAMEAWNFYIEKEGWQTISTAMPQYNNEVSHQRYLQILKEKELYEEWKKIWHERFLVISSEDIHIELYNDITAFIEDLLTKMNNPKWLKDYEMGICFNANSSLYFAKIDNWDATEFNRIRNLYISGIINGEYLKSKDPIYKE